jgi:hypothetical protein
MVLSAAFVDIRTGIPLRHLAFETSISMAHEGTCGSTIGLDTSLESLSPEM